MNKKGQLNVGQIVMLAVAIILGAVFIAVIAGDQNLLTEPQSVTNESFSLTTCYADVPNQVNESNSACNQTLSNVPSGWQVGDSDFDVFSVTVENGTEIELTLDTDYNLFAGTGVIQYLNTTDTEALGGNFTVTDYSFYDTGYNKDSGSRGIAKLFTLFFALIVLAVAVLGVKDWISK